MLCKVTTVVSNWEECPPKSWLRGFLGGIYGGNGSVLGGTMGGFYIYINDEENVIERWIIYQW